MFVESGMFKSNVCQCWLKYNKNLFQMTEIKSRANILHEDDEVKGQF